MKHLSFLITNLLVSAFIFAQTTSTVTVILNDTRTRGIMVDGKSFTSGNNNADNNTSNSTTNTIVIPDVQPGQHSLQLVRNRQSNYGNSRNTKSFTVNSGYDLQLTIGASGEMQIKESRIRNRRNNFQSRTAMSDANYDLIVQNVNNSRGVPAKMNVVNNAFSNSANYFTTSQASRLIQLVSGEKRRLQLAKSSYRSIVDPANFSQIYNVLNSQTSRAELMQYVNTYNEANNVNNTGYTNSYKSPMSDFTFNALVKDIQNQWNSTNKITAINNAFTNTNNYFTTYQAKQLIQLIQGENDRFLLARSSYRSITDPANFTQLNDLFSAQATRDELANYVRAYNSNNTGYANQYKVPMPETNFNQLKSDVQNQWNDANKMSAINNAFSNNNNYFTTYQVRQLIQLVTGENNRFLLARASYRSITDPANFTQLNDLFSAQATRDELANYVRSYNPNNSTTTNQYKTPMADANFLALLEDVRKQWLPGGKLSVVSNAFANTANNFSSGQARQLIEYVSEQSNRLVLAKASYKTITDPANFGQVADLLNSQSAKDDLAAYIRTYNSNNNSGYEGNTYSNKTPMSDADFNAITENVRRQWLPGAKMSAVSTAIANNNNYFSTSQAKQLIQFVSDETNRLQLAKSVYRNITDRANFSQLYDLFSSQSNKDELISYVNSYRD